MGLSRVIPSRRTENIRYAVRDVVVLAQEVARTGKEMLYLNIGDPNVYDFQLPEVIMGPTIEAMRRNHGGYSPSSGIPEAVAAIHGDAVRRGIENIQDVFVTTGASEAIEICLTALLNPGDNVLTPAPGYPLYTAVLAKLEAEENSYFLDEDRGWQPDVADMASKINPRTKAIVLINPNNPTGSVCSEDTLREVIALAKAHGLVIFADEIYDRLVLDGERHISIASLDSEVPFVTFNGLSKCYIGPGVRIGWGVASGPRELMADYIEAINRILRSRLCANHPFQYAIRPCLEGDHGHLPPVLEKLTTRRDITVEKLNANGISCVAPKGAFYAFARLEGVRDDRHWASELIRQTGVVVVPGSGFGQRPQTAHFRVVFLPEPEKLHAAYDKITAFHQAYRNP